MGLKKKNLFIFIVNLYSVYNQEKNAVFSLFSFNWRLITLQYCGGFCHTLIWISHGCTCVPHPEPPFNLPPHPIPQAHPSAPALSTLSHTSNLDWRSVSCMIIYMFQCWQNSDDCLSSCFIHTRSQGPSNWWSSSRLLMSVWPFDVIHTLSSRGCHCSKHFGWPVNIG